MSADLVEQARALRDEGLSYAKIAGRLGLEGQDAVRYLLNRPPGRTREEVQNEREQRVARAREMVAAKATHAQVAEALGVSKTTISRWLSPKIYASDRASSNAWKRRNRERVRAYGRERWRRKQAGEPTSQQRPESPFERILRERGEAA